MDDRERRESCTLINTYTYRTEEQGRPEESKENQRLKGEMKNTAEKLLFHRAEFG